MARKWTFRGPSVSSSSANWLDSHLNGIPSLKMVTLSIKTILIAVFDVEGLVHHEFVSRGPSMNHTVYKTVLQCLQDAVHQKLPSKLFPVPGFFTWTMHFAQWPWVSVLLAQLWFPICLTRFGVLWPLPVSQPEDHYEKGSILWNHRDPTEHNMAAAGHSEAGRPQALWIVEGFAGISVYNLEVPTLEKIIQGDLKML